MKTKITRPRPSYRRALRWIIRNEDTEWVRLPVPFASATAWLVADTFGKTEGDVIRDLRKLLVKEDCDGLLTRSA